MAKKIKNNVPEIRFQGYSENWEEKKLGELFPITSAARVHKHEWRTSGVPFFRSSDVVSAFKGTPNTEAFISHELYLELSEKVGCIKKGDMLVTGGGSIGIPYLVPSDEPLYFKDADLLWFKIREAVDSNFLYTFFSSQSFKKYVRNISHIGTIAHYTIEQAKSTPLFLPQESVEQSQIGEYFKELDQLIQLHQHKHEKLVTLKQAMLQKMFPQDGANAPEVRFKSFTGNWKETTLSQQAYITTGFPFNSSKFSISGDYLVITNGNIQNEDPFVDNKIGNRVTISNSAFLRKYILNSGDILVTMDGSVARSAKVNQERLILAQRVGRLTANSDPEFLYQSLNTGAFLKSMTEISSGGTIKHITLVDIGNFRLKFPPIVEEQQKIGAYFRKLDELISQHATQLEKLKQIKSACLAKMFV